MSNEFSVENVKKGIRSMSPVSVSLNYDSAVVRGTANIYHMGKDAAQEAYGNLTTWITAQRDNARGFFSNLRQSASEKFNQVRENVSERATAIHDGITNGVENGVNSVKTGFKKLGDASRDYSQQMKQKSEEAKVKRAENLEKMKESAKDGIQNLKSGAQNMAKTVKENMPFHFAINKEAIYLKAAAKFVKETFPNGVQSVRNRINEIQASAREKAAMMKEGAQNGVDKALMAVDNGLDYASNKVGAGIQAVGNGAKAAGRFVHEQSPIHMSVNHDSKIVSSMEQKMKNKSVQKAMRTAESLDYDQMAQANMGYSMSR